jgi:hypothetical protein
MGGDLPGCWTSCSRVMNTRPTGVVARWPRGGITLGLQIARTLTQGSSRLATLGWRTQSLWDCRFESALPLLVLCTAIVEIARRLRRNVAVSRLPIAPFLAIWICFGFRASDFGFPAPPDCALRVSAAPALRQPRRFALRRLRGKMDVGELIFRSTGAGKGAHPHSMFMNRRVAFRAA